MSNQSTSKVLRIFLAANCALFLCTVTVASVASLVLIGPSSDMRQAGDDSNQRKEAEQITLLQEAKAEIEEKAKALEDIRVELTSGYVVAKDINVTETQQAYWLSEPKLMLGVNSLSGGQLLISFADRTELISIGERIDFKVDDCDCFLLLKSSKFGHASFRYACTRAAREDSREVRNDVIDVKLN